MRICTRCYEKDGSVETAFEEIVFQRDDSHMEVCEECKNEIIEYINNPTKKKKAGRPKKNGK